jgi:FkbM family methyltransferase
MIDRLIQLYAHTPAHPAKLRLFDWLVRLLKGRRRLRLSVSGGLLMDLNPHDHVERSLILYDTHEELTTRFLLANLRSGERVAIAGAHVGYHVLHAARAVGSAGRVLAFEPEPSSLARALEHVALNGLSARVKVVGHALGDGPGYVPMGIPPSDNTGEATLGSAPADTSYQVYVDTLFQAAHRLGFAPIDLLLLDVEGYERRALAGLGTLRPRLMILESDPRFHARLGEPQPEFFALVRSLGYELHSLDGSVIGAEGFYPETNLIAVRTGEPAPEWPVSAA